MACKTPAAKQFFAKIGPTASMSRKILALHTGKHPKAENDCHDEPRHMRLARSMTMDMMYMRNRFRRV